MDIKKLFPALTLTISYAYGFPILQRRDGNQTTVPANSTTATPYENGAIAYYSDPLYPGHTGNPNSVYVGLDSSSSTSYRNVYTKDSSKDEHGVRKVDPLPYVDGNYDSAFFKAYFSTSPAPFDEEKKHEIRANLGTLADDFIAGIRKNYIDNVRGNSFLPPSDGSFINLYYEQKSLTVGVNDTTGKQDYQNAISSTYNDTTGTYNYVYDYGGPGGGRTPSDQWQMRVNNLYRNKTDALYRTLPDGFDFLAWQLNATSPYLQPKLLYNSDVPEAYRSDYDAVYLFNSSMRFVQGSIDNKFQYPASLTFNQDNEIPTITGGLDRSLADARMEILKSLPGAWGGYLALLLKDGVKTSAQLVVNELARILFPNVADEKIKSLYTDFGHSLPEQLLRLALNVNAAGDAHMVGSGLSPLYDPAKEFDGTSQLGRSIIIPQGMGSPDTEINIARLAYEQLPSMVYGNLTGWTRLEQFISAGLTAPNATDREPDEQFKDYLLNEGEYWLDKLLPGMKDEYAQGKYSKAQAFLRARVGYDLFRMFMVMPIIAGLMRMRSREDRRTGTEKWARKIHEYVAELGLETAAGAVYGAILGPWGNTSNAATSALISTVLSQYLNKTVPMLLNMPLGAPGMMTLLSHRGDLGDLGQMIGASLLSTPFTTALKDVLFTGPGKRGSKGKSVLWIGNERRYFWRAHEAGYSKTLSGELVRRFTPPAGQPLIKWVVKTPQYVKWAANVPIYYRARWVDPGPTPPDLKTAPASTALRSTVPLPTMHDGPLGLPSGNLNALWNFDERLLPARNDLERTEMLRRGLLARAITETEMLPPDVSLDNFRKFDRQALEIAAWAVRESEANPGNEKKSQRCDEAKDNYTSVIAFRTALTKIKRNNDRGNLQWGLENYSKDPVKFAQWFGDALRVASKNVGFILKAGSGLKALAECHGAYAAAFGDTQSLYYQVRIEDGVITLGQAIDIKRTEFIRRALERISEIKNQIVYDGGQVHVIDRYFQRVGIDKFHLDLTVDTPDNAKRFDYLLSAEEIEAATKIINELLAGNIVSANEMLDELKKTVIDELSKRKRKVQADIDKLKSADANYEKNKTKLENDSKTLNAKIASVERIKLDGLYKFYLNDSALSKSLAMTFPTLQQEASAARAALMPLLTDKQKELNDIYVAGGSEATPAAPGVSPNVYMAKSQDPLEKTKFAISRAVLGAFRTAVKDDQVLDAVIAAAKEHIDAAFESREAKPPIADTGSSNDAEIKAAQYERAKSEIGNLKPDDFAAAKEYYTGYFKTWKTWLSTHREFQTWKASEKGKEYRERLENEERLKEQIDALQTQVRNATVISNGKSIEIIKKYEQFNNLVSDKLKSLSKGDSYQWHPFTAQPDKLDLSGVPDHARDGLIHDLKVLELLYVKQHGIQSISIRKADPSVATEGAAGIEMQEVDSPETLRDKWITAKLVYLDVADYTPTNEDVAALKQALSVNLEKLTEDAIDSRFPTLSADKDMALPNRLVAKIDPSSNTFLASVDDNGVIQLHKTESALYKGALKVGDVTPDDFQSLGGPIVQVIDLDEYVNRSQLQSTTHRLPDWSLLATTEQGRAYVQGIAAMDGAKAYPGDANGEFLLMDNIRLPNNQDARAGKQSALQKIQQMDGGLRFMATDFQYDGPVYRGISGRDVKTAEKALGRPLYSGGTIENDPTKSFWSSMAITPFNWAAREWAAGGYTYNTPGLLIVSYAGGYVYVSHLRENRRGHSRPNHVELFPLNHDTVSLITAYNPIHHFTMAALRKADDQSESVTTSQQLETNSYLFRLGNLNAILAKPDKPEAVAFARLRHNISQMLEEDTPFTLSQILVNPKYQEKTGAHRDSYAALVAAITSAIDTPVEDRLFNILQPHLDARANRNDVLREIRNYLNPIARLYPRAYETMVASVTPQDRAVEDRVNGRLRGFPHTLTQARVLIQVNLKWIDDKKIRSKVSAYFTQELPHISQYIVVAGNKTQRPKAQKLIAILDTLVENDPSIKEAVQGMRDHLGMDLYKVDNPYTGTQNVHLNHLRIALIHEAKTIKSIDFKRFTELLQENNLRLRENTDLNKLFQTLKAAVAKPDAVNTAIEVLRPHLEVAKDDIALSGDRLVDFLRTKKIGFQASSDLTSTHGLIFDAMKPLDGPSGAKRIMEIIKPHITALDVDALNSHLEAELLKRNRPAVKLQLDQAPMAEAAAIIAIATQNIYAEKLVSGKDQHPIEDALQARTSDPTESSLSKELGDIMNESLTFKSPEDVGELLNRIQVLTAKTADASLDVAEQTFARKAETINAKKIEKSQPYIKTPRQKSDELLQKLPDEVRRQLEAEVHKALGTSTSDAFPLLVTAPDNIPLHDMKKLMTSTIDGNEMTFYLSRGQRRIYVANKLQVEQSRKQVSDKWEQFRSKREPLGSDRAAIFERPFDAESIKSKSDRASILETLPDNTNVRSADSSIKEIPIEDNQSIRSIADVLSTHSDDEESKSVSATLENEKPNVVSMRFLKLLDPVTKEQLREFFPKIEKIRALKGDETLNKYTMVAKDEPTGVILISQRKGVYVAVTKEEAKERSIVFQKGKELSSQPVKRSSSHVSRKP